MSTSELYEFIAVGAEKTRRTAIAGLLLLSLLAIRPLHAEDWTLRKNENAVQIYTRKTDQSSVEEFRGVVRVKGSVSSIVSLIEDIAAAPKWIEYSKEGRLIRQIGKRESLTYTITNLPWPFQNRDAVVDNRIQEKDDGSVLIQFQSKPGALPENPDMVRIRLLKGSWLIKPLGDSVEVTYTVLSDPGGGLPSWMVNLGIVDQPFKTLRRLQAMIHQEPYKDAK